MAPVKKQYHILNGDALKNFFPKEIPGHIIVARECMIDGRVDNQTLDDIFSARARFISHAYDENYTEQDYFNRTVSEFEKIKRIPPDAEINLWFEDDLFCQTNLWFVCYLLITYETKAMSFLVRPIPGCEYSFGKMSADELITAYNNRIAIEPGELLQLHQLWKLYEQHQVDNMLKIAEAMKHKYSFLKPAIMAHIDRLSKDGKPGRPVQTLLTIIDELKTSEFAPVFKEFCVRESIYGYGDLQVKRMMDDIVKR